MNHLPQSKNSNFSYLQLRKLLGILGILLPLILPAINNFELQPSISHFYYTPASSVFTGFLISFSLFLFCYPGRVGDRVFISDNWLTNIAGFGALLTALIPTAYNGGLPCSLPLEDTSLWMSLKKLDLPILHNHEFTSGIHLVSAGIFLLCMAVMSFWRFTLGKISRLQLWFFKFCGIMTAAPVLIIATKKIWSTLSGAENTPWFENEVYWLECISVLFFGIAWLVKGKFLRILGFR